MANFKAATDLDLLESQGFDREASKRALRATHGDPIEAKKILNGTLKDDGEKTTAWRNEYKGDFEAGVDSGRSLGFENRALVKTPLYCSVGDSVVRDGITFYTVNIIIKNGVRYSRLRRYSQFSALKSSLPMGTCASFQSTFPMKGLTIFGDMLGQKELRRAALDDWLREMSLNEACMTSPEVTSLFYDFLGYDSVRNDAIPEIEDKHSIGAGMTNQFAALGHQSKGSSSSRPSSSRVEVSAPPLVFASESDKATASLKNFSMVPKLDPNPCPVKDISCRLPFKTAISKMALDSLNQHAKHSAEGDDSRFQLAKDLKRDRIIINMKRISGSDTSVEGIVQTIFSTVDEILAEDSRPPLEASSAPFCENLLKQVSRTTSAYLTHMTFTSIIKQDPERPVTVVPASTLAEPLKIVISLRRKEPGSSRPGVGEYCIQCELEGSTVFRINDPLTDDLDTLVQCRCFYRSTIFGMPKERQDKNGEKRVELITKAGKAWLGFERETKTTREDWR